MSNKTIWRGYLEVAQIVRLRLIAASQKVSVSWLIRHAVDVAYPEPGEVQGKPRKRAAKQK